MIITTKVEASLLLIRIGKQLLFQEIDSQIIALGPVIFDFNN